MESILDSIKQMLGYSNEPNFYDATIIMHINTAFAKLFQMGVGPKNQAYKIVDSSNIWDEFLNGKTDIENVKTYVFLKTKIVFDPPQSASVQECIKQEIKECEWRLNCADEDN